MNRLRLAVSFLVLALCALVAGPAQVAHAAFPGSNGRIAFETGRTDEFDIWSMKPDGTGRKRLTRRITEEHNPSYCPDGSRIAFSRNRLGLPNGDILTMASDGTDVVRLTNTPSIDEGDPTWSPDSARIAFASSKTGGGDIYLMRASDGTHKQRFTSNPNFDFQPAWSQTNRIAFSSGRTGNGDIYVMRPDGSGRKRLTTSSAFEGQPTWSADGKRIAFVRFLNETNAEIFVMRADGSHVRRLTHNSARDQGPSFAPAGNRIAFMSDRGPKQFLDIYTVRTDGTGVRGLTHDGFVDGFPDWQALP